MYIEYSYKINFRICKDVYIEGMPKGYVDKYSHRQNYIHIFIINEIEINKEPPLYSNENWKGEKIKDDKMTQEEKEELTKIIQEFSGDVNE